MRYRFKCTQINFFLHIISHLTVSGRGESCGVKIRLKPINAFFAHAKECIGQTFLPSSDLIYAQLCLILPTCIKEC